MTQLLSMGLVAVFMTSSAVAQPPIDDLSPKVQEHLQDPWERALWDLSGIRNIVDEYTIPPSIDEEWAANDPDWYPQSWDECARLLDANQAFFDELARHAAGLELAGDMRESFSYRSVAQLARIDALHAASQADADRGARRIATMFDVGRAMMTDGGTLERLSGFAILGLAITTLEAELARPEPWLTEPHFGPLRDAFTRLAHRKLQWPVRPQLDEQRTELIGRLRELFDRLGVEPGLALDQDSALAPAWRGIWIGTLRSLELDNDAQDFVDKGMRNEIQIRFLPIDDDPTRATLTIRNEIIIGDLDADLAEIIRDLDPHVQATRYKLRAIDSVLRSWVIEIDEIPAEMRDQLEEDELAEAAALMDRLVLSAGQPTDDRFEISEFYPEFKLTTSIRMRLINTNTMEYERISMTPEPWSGSTVIREWATLTRVD
ncbi:MAG: hypothetical protein AAGB48_03925 [Planctomycetota bacterium]